MMKKVKVLTVVGTRPELIKLSEVIRKLDKHTEHYLAHTGQNYDYELNGVFFDDMGIRKPDFFLECAGGTAAETAANVISKTDTLLEQLKPDAFLILGDTNSCLSAYSAKRRQVPIFHMEAGNRCFDYRVPEEINRKIVDHLSDVNLVYTEHARRYLLAEGLKPELTHKTGSPMKEIYIRHKKKIEESTVLLDMNVEEKKYFVVSCHREENVDNPENFRNFIETLSVITEKYNFPVIVSTHPRTKKRLEELNISLDAQVRFLPPLSFSNYVKLQQSAYCTISDSGTITEEASILNFPAITIRQAHERPEGMDEGVLVMAGLYPSDVINAIDVVTTEIQKHIVNDYDVDNVSTKVLSIILSYIDYVNRVVWFKKPNHCNNWPS